MPSKYTKDILLPLVKSSTSVSQVLFKLGLTPSGGCHKTITTLIKEYNLDTSHFLGQANNIVGKNRKLPDDQIYIEHSPITRKNLKLRLIGDRLIPHYCVDCGNTGVHNNKALVLVIDHINGINDDNRLENLRFLCPNCHSQTDTFAGRNVKHVKIEKPKKVRLGITKIIWPPPENIQQLMYDMPVSKLAKQLGVSDSAIRDYAKKHSLIIPNNSYRTKQFWQNKHGE